MTTLGAIAGLVVIVLFMVILYGGAKASAAEAEANEEQVGKVMAAQKRVRAMRARGLARGQQLLDRLRARSRRPRS